MDKKLIFLVGYIYCEQNIHLQSQLVTTPLEKDLQELIPHAFVQML